MRDCQAERYILMPVVDLHSPFLCPCESIATMQQIRIAHAYNDGRPKIGPHALRHGRIIASRILEQNRPAAIRELALAQAVDDDTGSIAHVHHARLIFRGHLSHTGGEIVQSRARILYHEAILNHLVAVKTLDWLPSDGPMDEEWLYRLRQTSIDPRFLYAPDRHPIRFRAHAAQCLGARPPANFTPRQVVPEIRQNAEAGVKARVIGQFQTSAPAA